MTTNGIVKRGLGVLLLVCLAAASVAPAAQAGRGNGPGHYRGEARGHFRGPRVAHGWFGGPIVIERHSDAGPAIAGFLGGLVLGAVLSNAQPAPPPPPVYEYFDPYCQERFGSLTAYESHLRYHDHPWVIDVVDAHSGRCVDTYVWQDGHWGSDRDRAYEEDRGDE